MESNTKLAKGLRTWVEYLPDEREMIKLKKDLEIVAKALDASEQLPEIDDMSVLQIIHRYRPELQPFGHSHWKVFIKDIHGKSFPMINKKQYFSSLNELALSIIMEHSGIQFQTLIEQAKDCILGKIETRINSLKQSAERGREVVEYIDSTRKLLKALAVEKDNATNEYAQIELDFYYKQLHHHLVNFQMKELGI